MRLLVAWRRRCGCGGGARLVIRGQRRDDPAALTAIEYTLVLDSPEQARRLQELHTLASVWGTVSNTLRDGAALQGTLLVEPLPPAGAAPPPAEISP